MASILIRLDLMKRLWNQDIKGIYEEIDNVSDMGKETLADIRRIMFDLKPSCYVKIVLVRLKRLF